jgi:3-phenylpropionate/cinnamic acid dioxygenase small subunit
MLAQENALATRLSVEDVVVRLFVATDERDWKTVESCFADSFIFDMTSMTGGEPATITPRQVTQMWSEGLKALDHVHHQAGNFRTAINGDRARVRCYAIALHHRAKIKAAEKTRRFVGSYEYELTDQQGSWRITSFKFLLKFIDGNLELEKAS